MTKEDDFELQNPKPKIQSPPIPPKKEKQKTQQQQTKKKPIVSTHIIPASV